MLDDYSSDNNQPIFPLALSRSITLKIPTILLISKHLREAGANHTSHQVLETSEYDLRLQVEYCLQVPTSTTSIFSAMSTSGRILLSVIKKHVLEPTSII